MRERGVVVDVAPGVEAKRRGRNPFGAAAGLRISRNDYPRERARAFKRAARRWLKPLVLWDTTLKMVAAAGGIDRRFKPGFILQNGTIGMVEKRPDRDAVIYVHPDRFAEAVKENRERPLAVAAFLHGVAVHELTHLDGRLGEGHSEAFISAREDLGRRTAHLLPALSVLAIRLLGLPPPKDESRALVERLERQLKKAREARLALRQDNERRAGVLVGELEACRQQVQEQAEVLSANARAICTGSCGCRPGEASRARSPEAILTAVSAGLRVRPPEGVDVRYLEGFLARNRTALLHTISRYLGVL